MFEPMAIPSCYLAMAFVLPYLYAQGKMGRFFLW